MERVKSVLRVLLSLLILESAFAIHEYGHLREFQKRNVPVKEYSLGIGPRIWQHQTSSFLVSVRLIPIIAYVEPTKDGEKFFQEHVPLWGQIAVHAAGVRNNFLMGLSIVFLLQFLGWAKGNLTLRELVMALVLTPFKMVFRFVVFLIGTATFGKLKFNGRFLLSTGGIDPPKPIKKLAVLNLTLGILNFMPIPPLDGGHAAQAVLAAVGSHVHLPNIPNFVGVILFAVFFTSAQSQNRRVLEVEPQDESERNKSERSSEPAPTRYDDYRFERAPVQRRQRRTEFSWEAVEHWKNEGKKVDPEVLNIRVKLLPTLSTRVVNLLTNNGITTIGELRECTKEKLLGIKGLEPVSIEKIEETLSQWNLSLKPVE